jgi:phosphate transport system permease protein
MRGKRPRGESMIWITGGALSISLVMTLGLILLIMVNGLGVFWPTDIVRFKLGDGTSAMGMIRKRETIPAGDEKPDAKLQRLQLQTGNRELYGLDFRWIDDAAIASRDLPEGAVLLERRQWGHFVGFLKELRLDGKVVAVGGEEAWRDLQPVLAKATSLWHEVRGIELGEVGDISRRKDEIRLERIGRERRGKPVEDLDRESAELSERFNKSMDAIGKLRKEMERGEVLLETADGKTKTLAVAGLVRAVRPNTLGFFGKSGVYVSRFWEYLTDEPRESNTEGGVFPAIFGTVMMVFIMTLAVVPLGVLAALYLREYARQGPFVKAVRIAVNNLAGVPSIVFGVFGLGFFVYLLGGSIDKLFYSDVLPTATWGTGGILWASLTLALLTVPVVIVATEEGLSAVPSDYRNGSLALGANKVETLWKIVLPNALPGILTGVILAMARAAGEVAPLMITGVVKLQQALPVDGTAPYVHLERKFMHLGFHIYDVGFQSPNVEAARPMVFVTAFLLLAIVVALNLVAITVRNRLRRKLKSSTF